ncbi:hypothetical protein, variant [Cladophialophora immunda]|uniref:Uncharacterized protein n=1 Tax=Cladophialophora immunda TaxID=569365 RepID=A0A0D2CKB8_9EURO|nr:hypothetical protein, variant [Cladophialophora immunda]KIW31608.1 hypothetical protein, variant [Cladophialophora immunda]
MDEDRSDPSCAFSRRYAHLGCSKTYPSNCSSTMSCRLLRGITRGIVGSPGVPSSSRDIWEPVRYDDGKDANQIPEAWTRSKTLVMRPFRVYRPQEAHPQGRPWSAQWRIVSRSYLLQSAILRSPYAPPQIHKAARQWQLRVRPRMPGSEAPLHSSAT